MPVQRDSSKKHPSVLVMSTPAPWANAGGEGHSQSAVSPRGGEQIISPRSGNVKFAPWASASQKEQAQEAVARADINAMIKEQVEPFVRMNDSLRENVKALRAELARSNKQVEDLQKREAANKDKLAKITGGTGGQADGETAQLKKVVKSLREELDVLRKQKGGQENTGALQDELRNYRLKERELNFKIKTLEDDAKQQAAEVDRLHQLLDARSHSTTGVASTDKMTIDCLRSEVAEGKERERSLQKENSILQQKVTVLETRYKQMLLEQQNNPKALAAAPGHHHPQGVSHEEEAERLKNMTKRRASLTQADYRHDDVYHNKAGADDDDDDDDDDGDNDGPRTAGDNPFDFGTTGSAWKHNDVDDDEDDEEREDAQIGLHHPGPRAEGGHRVPCYHCGAVQLQLKFCGECGKLMAGPSTSTSTTSVSSTTTKASSSTASLQQPARASTQQSGQTSGTQPQRQSSRTSQSSYGKAATSSSQATKSTQTPQTQYKAAPTSSTPSYNEPQGAMDNSLKYMTMGRRAAYARGGDRTEEEAAKEEARLAKMMGKRF